MPSRTGPLCAPGAPAPAGTPGSGRRVPPLGPQMGKHCEWSMPGLLAGEVFHYEALTMLGPCCPCEVGNPATSIYNSRAH